MQKAFLLFCLASLVANLVANLVGCSAGLNQAEDARSQQARDAKALEETYGAAIGKWTGQVTNATSGLAPFQAELVAYIYYVQEGVNADGSAQQRPTLRGRFRPIDFTSETDAVILVGDYDRSGRLVMTTQNGESKMLSLRGQVAGEALSLEVTREGGVWGVFDAKRVSREASAPTAGEQAETRDRLVKQYSQLEGRYQGVLKTPDGNDYAVEIAVVMIEEPVASAPSGSARTGVVAQPALVAQYRRLDAPAGNYEWALVVQYNSQTGEVAMRDNGTGRTSLPGGASLYVSGRFEDVAGKKQLNVTVRNNKSVLGTLRAVR